MLPTLSYANLKTDIKPEVIENIFDKIKNNNNWKETLVTGSQAQVVLMSISPVTNPKNESGIETNECDQIIIILEGTGKIHLDRTIANIKENDMIFIPEGIPYNIINLNKNTALKLMSIYTETDMSANTVLPTKASVN